MRLNLLLTPIVLLAILFPIPLAEGHVPQGQNSVAGGYSVWFRTQPDYILPGDEAVLIFSVQDLDGNDVDQLAATMKIRSGSSLLYDSPIMIYSVGDFSIPYSVTGEGDLIVSLNIIADDQIAQFDFPISIGVEVVTFPIANTVALVSTTILGLTAIFFLEKRKGSGAIGASTISGPGGLERRREGGTTLTYLVRGLFFLSIGVLLSLLVLSPWAGFLEERELAFHMLGEHIGFSLGTVLISYGSEYLVLSRLGSARDHSEHRHLRSLYTRIILLNRRLNIHGRLGVPIAAFLLIYWHLPANFSAAVLADETHMVMHLSLILVGLVIFSNIKVLSRGEAIAQGVILGMTMLVGGIMMIILPYHFYTTYPFSQQGETGLIMAAPHPFILTFLLVHQISRYLWRE